MSKKVLHLQLPVRVNSAANDDFLVSVDVLGKFMRMCQKRLGEDWVVISSPTIASVSEDVKNFYNFDMNIMSKDELLDLIKEK